MSKQANKSEKRVYNNLYMTVPIFDKGKTLRKSYDFNELEDILLSVPFSKVPVPVNVYRNEYDGDYELRGNFIVGYITDYDPETRCFELTILERFADRVSQYNDPIVYPRAVIDKNGVVVAISGFDVCNKGYYASLYK